MQILKVTDEAFRQYGKVIKDLDVSDIITAMSMVRIPCAAPEAMAASDRKSVV